MLEIDITPYGPGTHHVSLESSAEAVGLDAERFREVGVDAVLHCQRDRILATLDARAVAELTCDRTLQDYDQPIAGTYTVLFAPPGTAKREHGDEQEVRDLSPADHSIEVTDVVRDTLLLAVPQRQVAPGAEDREIDTAFGAPEGGEDETIDPRWEALRELRSDESST